MAAHAEWLHRMLRRNAQTAWLRQYGSPRTVSEFRNNVPLCAYADVLPFVQRMQAGEPDVLFTGMPVAYERTGGSSDGPKLIPYSADGLLDFQRNIQPWLERTIARHEISGSVYFSISPATRKPEWIGSIPVGLPDTAYLGASMAAFLASRTAVPFEIAAIENVSAWRDATINHLARAHDLELISVWSPVFLLRLLEHIPAAAECWPRLKLVSCWADGPSRNYAAQLRELLPQATIQVKGLMATEAVMTVPDAHEKPVMAAHGFMEFLRDGASYLEDELIPGATYEIAVTTSSGLYRYRTGDFVCFSGLGEAGRPVLEFVGRNALVCDLVGEKLTEPFVRKCLDTVCGFALLIPDVEHPGYVLVCAQPLPEGDAGQIESQLRQNPQYAYARDIGQLAPLRVMVFPAAEDAYERYMLAHGARLGDLKPVALRRESFWLGYFRDFSGGFSSPAGAA